MVELVICVAHDRGTTTHYYNPQKDYDYIYDFLTERLGWSHEEAEEVASWAELGPAGTEYETDHPNVKIQLTEDEEGVL